MARDKLNSDILSETPLSQIWMRLCNNALGLLDPPLTQTEQMSIGKVLDKHIPNLQAQTVDLNATGDLNITVLQYSEHNDT